MSIAHSKLMKLVRFGDQFPLLGELLHGATIEVSCETDGRRQTRTHLITDASAFPLVAIAAEGLTRQVKRQFFGSGPIYGSELWDVVDEGSEALIFDLVEGKHEQDAASSDAVLAELGRQRMARVTEALELAALRSADTMAESRARLLAAYRDRTAPRRWDLILRDLVIVADLIERETDRLFVTDLFVKRRRSFFTSYTERRLAWLVGVLQRTRHRLEASALSTASSL